MHLIKVVNRLLDGCSIFLHEIMTDILRGLLQFKLLLSVLLSAIFGPTSRVLLRELFPSFDLNLC